MSQKMEDFGLRNLRKALTLTDIFRTPCTNHHLERQDVSKAVTLSGETVER